MSFLYEEDNIVSSKKGVISISLRPLKHLQIADFNANIVAKIARTDFPGQWHVC